MENKKIKLYGFTNNQGYILLSLEKTENSIILMEDLLEDLHLSDKLGDPDDCLKEIDKIDTFFGENIVQIILGKNKFFFITNVQDEVLKKNFINRVKGRTEFVKFKKNNKKK